MLYFCKPQTLRVRVRRGEASPLGGSRLVCRVEEHWENGRGWSCTGRETLCPQAERGQQRTRLAGHWRAVIKQRGVLDQQVGDSVTLPRIYVCQHHLDPAPYQTRSHQLPRLPRILPSIVEPRQCLTSTNQLLKLLGHQRKGSELQTSWTHLAQSFFTSSD